MKDSLQKHVDTIRSNEISKKGSFNFKDVHVFTMPKGFKKRNMETNNEADTAKKTGFIILLVGSLFLLLLLGGAFYYFVMKPAKTVDTQVSQNIEQSGEKVNVVSQDNTGEQKNKEEKVVPAGVAKNNKTVELDEIITEEQVADISTTTEPSEELSNDSNSQEPATSTEEVLFASIVDADEDGLSESEELAIGTSDFSPDSDNDSYADLSELLNGYNPAGAGSIIDNQNFVEYNNSDYSFSFYYPKKFLVSEDTKDVFVLNLGDEEFFQFFIEANENKLNLEDWYKKQFNIDRLDQNLVSKKDGWVIVRNTDPNSFFFKNDNKDFVIAFNYSSQGTQKYLNVFEAVFSTFKIVD